MKKRSLRGMSLLEVMAVAVILAIVSLGVAQSIRFVASRQVENDWRAVAIQHCLRLVEEARKVAALNYNVSYQGLVGYIVEQDKLLELDTKGGKKPVPWDTRFEYMRRIAALTGEESGREILVEVYRKGEMLADSSVVVRTPSRGWPATALHRVINLSIQTGFEQEIASFYRSAIPMTWNWISPFISGSEFNKALRSFEVLNVGLNSRVEILNKPALNRTSFDGLRQTYGKYSTNEGLHAARYPDALAAGAAQTGNAAEDYHQASLQIMLEKMIQRDPTYKNILLFNLLGGVIQVPPMRNYSDAAKDPVNLPERRAVTHPENLQVNAGDPVNLRVYTFTTSPASFNDASTLADVTVLVKAPVPAGTVTVRHVTGNSGTAYAWGSAVSGTHYTEQVVPEGLKITLKNSRLRSALHAASGSGLDASKRLQGFEYVPCPVGTAANPTGFAEGQKDLTTADAAAPKNTARWVIQLPAGALSTGEIAIETRLGDQIATGTPTNYPENLSRTYVWVGRQPPYTEQYQFVGDPRHMPYSDVKARHGYNRYFINLPASTGYEGYSSTWLGWKITTNVPRETTTQNAQANCDVPRFMELWREALLNSNAVFVDYNAFQDGQFAGILSLGEMDTGDLHYHGSYWLDWQSSLKYYNPNQFKANDASTHSSEFTTSLRPLGRPNYSYSSLRLFGEYNSKQWVQRPSIGEFVPDNSYTAIKTNGWVPWAGSNGAPWQFYRAPYSDFTATWGYASPQNFQRMLYGSGAALLINGNPAGAGNNYFSQTYQPHIGAAPNYDPAPEAAKEGPSFKRVLGALKFSPVRLNVLSTFDINRSAGPGPTGYDLPEYVAKRTRVTLLDTTYTDQSGDPAVGILRVQDPADSSRVFHLVVNGTGRQDIDLSATSSAVPLWPATLQAFAHGVWAQMRAGDPTAPAAGRSLHAPYVTITKPKNPVFENPSAITIDAEVAWRRWDGKPYTPEYPDDYASADTVRYNVLVSTSLSPFSYEGSMKFIQDGSPALRNRFDAAHEITLPYEWNVSGLPKGLYAVIVFAYPEGRSNIIGYRRMDITIKRD